MIHHTIPLLSLAWYLGLLAGILIVTVVCLVFYAIAAKSRATLATILGCVLLGEIVFTHIYLATIQDTWALSDSLPLHLCRMSFVLAGLALITKSQVLFEWSAYLGLPGGMESILTPELTQGTSHWMVVDYYFSHSFLLAVPIVMSAFLLMKPRRRALVNIFFVVNCVAAVVFVIDRSLGANYMYLLRKPLVDSPFLIGPWPWYILGLEVAAMIHLLVMDVIFRVRPYGPLFRTIRATGKR